MSAHARYAAHTALTCGYAFRSLDGADGYLFEICDGDRKAVFAAGAGTPYALNDARAAAIARDKAFCAEVLRSVGAAVVPGEMFFVSARWSEMRHSGREPKDALAFAVRADYPVFCKPLAASNGLFAEVIDNANEFADYVARVSREHFAILVQPYVRAPEHRVFVLNGRALFSYAKTAPRVVGDGVQSLSALVGAMPRDPEAPPLRPRGRDASGVKIDASQIVAAGAVVTLEGPANRAAGGSAAGVEDGAPEPLARLALQAAEALRLRLAAVDMFECADGPMIIEVNSNPMIATLEEQRRWDLIEAIWSANFEAALR